MRVLVLVIASHGEAYDGMRRAWDVHLRAAPACIDARFLYGSGGSGVFDTDVVYEDVPECIVPGALDKTVRFLKDLSAEGYDYVVRTNLSSWFHWDRLVAWLRGRPRAGFAAGFSPADRTHLTGCNLTLSRDLAAGLASAPLDRGLVDDLAWSPWLFSAAAVVECVPRLDLVYDDHVYLHGDVDAAWHVRLKHTDRDLDVALMDFLAREYDPGQDVAAHAVAALRAVGLAYESILG